MVRVVAVGKCIKGKIIFTKSIFEDVSINA